MLEINRDVTRIKRAEAELAARAAELERSNRELQDFASIASHDLQEPLRKVITFGERLETRCAAGFDEVGRDYLARMRNAAERMSSLINGLLDYSRVTTRARPFELVKLEEVAAEVLLDLEARIQETNAHVVVGALPARMADRLQMRQLLQNLLANALKFRRPGAAPRVRLSSRYRDDGSWEIAVEDNGIGFDEAYAERIFRPFQRLHGRNEYEGSGMGLAICRKIVARHGGTIAARSKPGHGAVFTFTLPPQAKEEASDEQVAAGDYSHSRG